MFTDSIPLFAILFKIISPLFHGDFQFFGIYGLFAFIMQGILAAKITEIFTKNKIIILSSSVLFILMPPLFFRIFGHHSLSSHYLILTAIFIVLKYHNENNIKKDAVLWVSLLAVTPAIHLYFFPMTFILLCAYVLYKIITYKNLKYAAIPPLALAGVCIVLYIIGAFHRFSFGNNIDGGVGYFSFNLNAFFNPMFSDYSAILPALSKFSGQYEGFAYAGFGNILIVITAILSAIYLIWHSKGSDNKEINKTAVIIITLTVIIFIVLATGGNFTFGDKELGKIGLKSLLGTFRASGRFSWAPLYIILTVSLFAVTRLQIFPKLKYALPAMFLLFAAVQVYDLHKLIKNRYIGFQERSHKTDTALNDAIKTVKEQGFNYAFLMDNNIQYGYYFITNDFKLRGFYISRPRSAMKKNTETLAANLLNGKQESDTVYFTEYKDMLLPPDVKDKIHAYKIKKFLLISTAADKTVDNLAPYNLPDTIDIKPPKDKYVKNGKDNEKGIRILHKNGISYGPYIPAASAKYILEVKGENLDAAYADAYSNRAQTHVKPASVKATNNSLIAEIDIPEANIDWEFRIINPSETDIGISSITLTFAAP